MSFSSKPLVMRVFMHPPEFEISTLLLAALKEFGGLALMVSVMLFLGLPAIRSPTWRSSTGISVRLCILAVTPLVSLYTSDLSRLYPTYLVWGRSFVPLALAGVLYYLRPRRTGWKPVGNF